MLNRQNIHHSAMLKAEMTKCLTVRNTGQHAYTKTSKGYQQCIDCGKIKPAKDH